MSPRRRLEPPTWRACALAALATLAAAPLPAAEHRVRPRAVADHPDFTLRSFALPAGALLACYVRGEFRQRAPLVLVPETHGDRTQFFEPSFLDGLPAGLPLVVIESRGQGRSWPPPGPDDATVERYADDVLAVVAALHPPAWYLGGHSLGGMIALEAAGRRPPGLRGVVSLEGWVHSRVARIAFPAPSRTAAQQAEAVAQRAERYRSQRWTPEEQSRLVRAWTAWSRGEAILRDLQVPLLSVWGDRGLHSRPGRDALLLPDRPDVELVWIPGADHYVTDPPGAALTAAAITRFLHRIEDRPAAAPLSPALR